MSISSVVVVGGGIAGVTMASELRTAGYDGDLLVLDAGHLPYDRPPLSKEFLTGDASEQDLALASPSWYDEHQIGLRVRSHVCALDSASGTVQCADGFTMQVDAVVLATGARARRLPAMCSRNEHVHLLRTLEDAYALRARLASSHSITVIGGGLIGAEVAASAARMGLDVTVIEPLDPPLTTALGAELAHDVHALHRENGVRVITDAVCSVTATPVSSRVELESGAAIESDVVVVGIGGEPVTSLAETAHLEVANGVVVDDHHRTSNPAIYAIGDVARIRARSGEWLPRNEHWEAAQHSARVAVAALLGQPSPTTSAPWFWSDRYGRRIESVGSMSGPGATVARRDATSGTARMAFHVRGGVVVGAAGVDSGRDIKVARRMIDRGVAVRVDELADPAVHLRKLLGSDSSCARTEMA